MKFSPLPARYRSGDSGPDCANERTNEQKRFSLFRYIHWLERAKKEVIIYNNIIFIIYIYYNIYKFIKRATLLDHEI